MFLLLLLPPGVLLEFGSLGCGLLPPLAPQLQLGLSQRFPLPRRDPEGQRQRRLGAEIGISKSQLETKTETLIDGNGHK